MADYNENTNKKKHHRGPRKKGAQAAERRRNNHVAAKRRGRKKSKSDLVTNIILIVAIFVFLFAGIQLVRTLIPYYSGGKDYDKIKDLAITVTEKDEEEENKFQVDFNVLLETNPDTIGWIRFDEPSIISYPIVKSADNVEYLTKTFTANDNKLGAIFMDKNSNSSFTDRNTLIYGHNMKVGGEMFSQLNEYASEEFCKEHPYFYIYTPDGNVHTSQVFSAAVVKDTAPNYTMTFPTEQEFLNYLQLCKDTSNYPVDVNLDVTSKIVSLSTCTNVRDDERFLVQGVLIKTEKN